MDSRRVCLSVSPVRLRFLDCCFRRWLARSSIDRSRCRGWLEASGSPWERKTAGAFGPLVLARSALFRGFERKGGSTSSGRKENVHVAFPRTIEDTKEIGARTVLLDKCPYYILSPRYIAAFESFASLPVGSLRSHAAALDAHPRVPGDLVPARQPDRLLGNVCHSITDREPSSVAPRWTCLINNSMKNAVAKGTCTAEFLRSTRAVRKVISSRVRGAERVVRQLVQGSA